MSAPDLATGLRTLGLPTDPRLCERLLAYRDELARWNQVHNLSGVKDPARMVAVHLLDSLALAPLVRGQRLADVGSGGGLPGMPLALLRPELEVVLIEPRAKRALFLDHVVRTLGLGNVIVERSRAEDVPVGAGFDTLTARAFGTLGEFVAIAGHLVRARGILLAAKGRDPRTEAEALPSGWSAEILPLVVPGIEAERHAVRLFRTRGGERETWAGP